MSQKLKTTVFMLGSPIHVIQCTRITGGTLIHVWGHNFPEAQGDNQYTCKFGADVVNATREAWNHVTCRAPQHVAGDVILEISADGVECTNNDVRNFQPVMCGSILPGSDDRIHRHGSQCVNISVISVDLHLLRDVAAELVRLCFDLPKSQCLVGGCSCSLPGTDNDCAVELLALAVETLADAQLHVRHVHVHLCNCCANSFKSWAAWC